MFRSVSERGSSSASQEASGSKRKKAVYQVNDALFELHKPEGTPSMEIVLFHGLHLGKSSDAHLSTWEVEDGSIWPQKWLVEEYPAAHIFTVSYSGGVGKTSYEKFDMYIIVENLISDLRDANIGQTPYCPVVLVGHCFGGLVIKQLCLESRKLMLNWREDERAKAQSFLDNIRGIFYYGTAHHGSPLISPLANECNSPLLKYFRILSTEAGRLNFEFDRLCRSYPKWRVGGLGESLPTESGMFQGVVAAGEGSSRQGDFYNVFATDHISISKPSSKNDRRFYSFTSLLKDIAKNSEEEGKKREEIALREACPQNFQRLPEPMVNIDAEVERITSKLETMRTLGLAGMGGLGKTTLAMAIFNKLGPSFQYTCFVEDVKLVTGSVYEVKDAIWKHMHCSGKRVGGETNFSLLNGKKLLLVLDDISIREIKILQNLKNDSGLESRFIATSRDQELLRSLDANTAEVHMVPILNEKSAELLFTKVAFASEAGPPIELESLFQAIVKKCDGLPLTLNVLGSRLRQTRSYKVWDQTLNALTEAEYVKGLDEKLWKKLQVSYDLLEPKEQQMFLDVCTFFGNNTNWTLHEAKLSWRAAYKTQCEMLLWETLVDMSLVYNVEEDENIKVHEQLQSLGRRIAAEPINLARCRIWNGKMALEILECEEMSHGKEIYAMRLVELEDHDSKDGDSNGNESKEFKKPNDDDPDGNESKKFEENDSKDDDSNGSESKTFEENDSKDGDSSGNELKEFEEPNDDDPDGNESKQFEENDSKDDDSNGSESKTFEENDSKDGDSSGNESKEFEEPNDDDSDGNESKKFEENDSNDDDSNGSESKTFEENDSKGDDSNGNESKYNVSNHQIHIGGIALQKLKNAKFLEVDVPVSMIGLDESQSMSSKLVLLKCYGVDLLKLTLETSLVVLKLSVQEDLPQSFGKLKVLQSLYLFECSMLKDLPNSFGHLANLNHLQFYDCPKLQTLPNSFGHLATLNHLEFRRCHNLQTLPDSFGHLATLNHLEFHYCEKLQTLPDSFGHLATLNHLEFHSCEKLQTLPDSFGHLATLNHLEFNSCEKLQALPDSFGHLATLNHLEFYSCGKLRTLPDSFGHLATLNILKFSRCYNLQTLPDSFGHLATLNHLQFFACVKLRTLPDSFGHLATLTHLDLIFCEKLQTLPDSFGHLATLNHLEFFACKKLQTLPDSFGHLATLNHLEFHDCYVLQTLPDSFGHLATLNHLVFQYCVALQTLPDSFGHLATLNHLEFHWCNNLQTLPDSFGHLATLNHLEFHWCHNLQTLPDSFGHLATLNHLEFRGCGELQTLPDSFGHLATVLNHLEFHDCNKLHTLPDSFGHLATLNHLEFHGCVECRHWLFMSRI